jgi:hypothetical protein
MRYIYLGDRLTDPRFIGAACEPVYNTRGKCIVGAGKALVIFSWGEKVVVLRRRLRLASKWQLQNLPGKIRQPLSRNIPSNVSVRYAQAGQGKRGLERWRAAEKKTCHR